MKAVLILRPKTSKQLACAEMRIDPDSTERLWSFKATVHPKVRFLKNICAIIDANY